MRTIASVLFALAVGALIFAHGEDLGCLKTRLATRNRLRPPPAVRGI